VPGWPRPCSVTATSRPAGRVRTSMSALLKALGEPPEGDVP